jgi:hypothetical protein
LKGVGPNKKRPQRDVVTIKGEQKLYSGSYSRGLILYSKKEGIGYRSPFGEADEGSEVFLSTIGCLLNVIEGLPVPIVLGIVAVVKKFIFCIGKRVKGSTIYQPGAYSAHRFNYEKIIPIFFSCIAKCNHLFSSLLVEHFPQKHISSLIKKIFTGYQYGTVL